MSHPSPSPDPRHPRLPILPRHPDPPCGSVTWHWLPGKGRGIIATADFPAGTEVERSPVIVVPKADLLVRAQPMTVPDQYLLYWSDETGRELCMGGGFLMFYNHADDPNIEFIDGPDPETMSVITLRDVQRGEELVYDYGVDLWFDPVPPVG